MVVIESFLSPFWGLLLILILFIFFCKLYNGVVRIGRWAYINGYWFPKTVREMREENIIEMNREMALLDQKIYELEHNVNLEFHLGEGELAKGKSISETYLPYKDSVFEPVIKAVTDKGREIWHEGG